MIDRLETVTYQRERMFLFVYGILKGTMSGEHIMSRADGQFVARATARDHTLYTSGIAYMVAKPGEHVIGEVWTVDAEKINRIDSVEGIRDGRAYGAYRREMVTVDLDTLPGVRLRTWAYVCDYDPQWMLWLGTEWTYEKVDEVLRKARKLDEKDAIFTGQEGE